MTDTTVEADIKPSEELDVGSEQFNPLRALYAADYKVTAKAPKVLYQNLAAFESALAKFGVWQLDKRQKKNAVPEPENTKSHAPAAPIVEPSSERRFQPHQMPVGSQKMKYQRNLFTHMAGAEGPLASLKEHLHSPDKQVQTRLRVYLRKEHSIGGTIEGELVAFDKQWNLLMENAVEVWQRRKYAFGEQNICSTPSPEECSKRLRRLGIELPAVQVKSLSRKNVQFRRDLPKVMIRGENVAFITFVINSDDKT